MESPSLQLADKILEHLVNDNLLNPVDQGKLRLKLAEGKLKAEDWRLALELAQDRGQ
jgi:hypothetical protein